MKRINFDNPFVDKSPRLIIKKGRAAAGDGVEKKNTKIYRIVFASSRFHIKENIKL